MTRHGLLLVDDEKDILTTLQITFEEEFEVFTASSGEEALAILRVQDIAVIVADQRMPAMTGVELLKRSIEIKPHCIRMILTGYTDTGSLIEAINCGHIYQYVTKPWERHDIKLAVRRGLESYLLALENRRLLEELRIANDLLRVENRYLRHEMAREWKASEIVGESQAMRKVFDLVGRVLGKSVSILLTGETGTGKTLLARFIHDQGPRRGKMFVEQNCGALPETLLESELFGHRRGAFTGALHDQKGLFEAADGGTIFLDEVSEMSPTLQSKLLQVLQDGSFRRVGDNDFRQSDVRIIAATNRDLSEEIRHGRFRQDLYYRIAVFPIHIPPLRERRADIPVLARFCLHKYGDKLNSLVTGFSEEAMAALCAYDYPGNVRELENMIERALILAPDTQIEVGSWLPVQITPEPGPEPDQPEPPRVSATRLEDLERREIERLMTLHSGNATRVAEVLGISRTTLWRRLRQYGAAPDQAPAAAQDQDVDTGGDRR